MPSIIGKDSLYEGKTICFTVSDGGDRTKLPVTQYNKLILNKLKQKVTDN